MTSSLLAATAATLQAQSLRSQFIASQPGKPSVVIQLQKTALVPKGDVVYVHGATFGADLSIFFPFDGKSWADSIASQGYNVWGFDFAGFGKSDRYSAETTGPAGAINDAVEQLGRVIKVVHENNQQRPIVLLAHSRGGSVAAAYLASESRQSIAALGLFAPIFNRSAPAPSAAPNATPAAPPPSVYALSALSQYRRFIDDVPRGATQVLSEAHMQPWIEAFLASDANSSSRLPRSVIVPFGPVADIGAMWSGKALFDVTKITVPTVLIRGQWDSLCNDADAAKWMAMLSSADKTDIKIEKATHLMHLENQRVALYDAFNNFLLRNLR